MKLSYSSGCTIWSCSRRSSWFHGVHEDFAGGFWGLQIERGSCRLLAACWIQSSDSIFKTCIINRLHFVSVLYFIGFYPYYLYIYIYIYIYIFLWMEWNQKDEWNKMKPLIWNGHGHAKWNWTWWNHQVVAHQPSNASGTLQNQQVDQIECCMQQNADCWMQEASFCFHLADFCVAFKLSLAKPALLDPNEHAESNKVDVLVGQYCLIRIEKILSY